MTSQDGKKIALEYYAQYGALRRMSMEMATEIDATGEKLTAYLAQCDDGRYVDDEAGFSVDYVQPQGVLWDVEELERKAPVYVSREVVRKKLAVDNEIMFVALMNRFGVPMEDFWQCVSIEKAVDTKRLEHLIDIGEVDREMLEGTFQIVDKKPFIRVTDKK